ncbi:hypothetical protein DW66_5777 [Pseudomonas putida]|nr:hypothetical protein DW66_5777 [Pseudomonas putida]
MHGVILLFSSVAGCLGRPLLCQGNPERAASTYCFECRKSPCCMGAVRLTSHPAAKRRCNMQKQIDWKSAADGMIGVTMERQPTSRTRKANSKEGNRSVCR